MTAMAVILELFILSIVSKAKVKLALRDSNFLFSTFTVNN